jgi:hypothetical protein
MRTLEKPDTSILTGMQLYHNYIRPHEALKGKTPSEAAGIKVERENRWLTLIQNASRKSNDERGNSRLTHICLIYGAHSRLLLHFGYASLESDTVNYRHTYITESQV